MILDTIKNQKLLIAFVFLSFFISFAHSLYFRIEPSVDARAYDKIAVNLINGRGYSEETDVPLEKDFSIVRVGPGYEFFLALVYKTFGHKYGAVWFFQGIFHALTALFVFFLSKRIFKDAWRPPIGFAAASLIAFSPDLILASSMLLTENLAVFLIALASYFFFRYFNEAKWRDFLFFTLFFSFSVFVRS